MGRRSLEAPARQVDLDQKRDPAGPLGHHQDAVAKEHRLRDAMGDKHDRLLLLGLNTAVVDAVRSAAILTQLTPLFEARTLEPPSIAAEYPTLGASLMQEALVARV